MNPENQVMSNQTENFYNKFSFLYPLVDLFLKPHKRKLFQEINSLPEGHLLEIGVGNGNHLSLYQKHHVIGIDTSGKMLEMAKKHKAENVELLEMSGEKLLFHDQSFDYVIMCHVIAVVDQPEKLLEETYRVLKPGGKIFILNHFTPKNSLRHIDHSFQAVSKIFHFQSVFYINRLKAIRKFELIKEIGFGRFSYFKLLIFSKA